MTAACADTAGSVGSKLRSRWAGVGSQRQDFHVSMISMVSKQDCAWAGHQGPRGGCSRVRATRTRTKVNYDDPQRMVCGGRRGTMRRAARNGGTRRRPSWDAAAYKATPAARAAIRPMTAVCPGSKRCCPAIAAEPPRPPAPPAPAKPKKSKFAPSRSLHRVRGACFLSRKGFEVVERLEAQALRVSTVGEAHVRQQERVGELVVALVDLGLRRRTRRCRRKPADLFSAAISASSSTTPPRAVFTRSRPWAVGEALGIDPFARRGGHRRIDPTGSRCAAACRRG